jgi:DNA-directed RNA polymerase subunit M/transcription elongation factor TFIIS
MKFCNNCNNILIISTHNDILKYKCNICLAEYDTTPENTLMLNVSFEDNNMIYKNSIYLNLAEKDHIAKQVYKNCSNTSCDENIMKLIILNNKGVYVCPKCSNKFVD